jgi:uncharacterized membrane protein YeaQ/YmgE (transglycosylase-associated protein family)
MLGAHPESPLEYVWFVVVGLAVGLVVGRFLQGNNFGIVGDMAFAVGGALVFGIGLGASGIVPEGGVAGRVVMAGLGAIVALFLRRVMRSV